MKCRLFFCCHEAANRIWNNITIKFCAWRGLYGDARWLHANIAHAPKPRDSQFSDNYRHKPSLMQELGFPERWCLIVRQHRWIARFPQTQLIGSSFLRLAIQNWCVSWTGHFTFFAGKLMDSLINHLLAHVLAKYMNIWCWFAPKSMFSKVPIFPEEALLSARSSRNGDGTTLFSPNNHHIRVFAPIHFVIEGQCR